MNKYFLSILIIFVMSTSNAGGLSCKSIDGAWVGEGEQVYQRILSFATMNERTRVWIVFDLSFTPDEDDYLIELQDSINEFALTIEQDEYLEHVQITGGFELAPGRYASVTAEGAAYLSSHPMVQCLSHMDRVRKFKPEAEEMITPVGISQPGP